MKKIEHDSGDGDNISDSDITDAKIGGESSTMVDSLLNKST